jgi:hypothetical protein
VSGALATVLGFGAISLAGSADTPTTGFDQEIAGNAERLLREGKETFRFDTFGAGRKSRSQVGPRSVFSAYQVHAATPAAGTVSTAIVRARRASARPSGAEVA